MSERGKSWTHPVSERGKCPRSCPFTPRNFKCSYKVVSTILRIVTMQEHLSQTVVSLSSSLVSDLYVFIYTLHFKTTHLSRSFSSFLARQVLLYRALCELHSTGMFSCFKCPYKAGSTVLHIVLIRSEGGVSVTEGGGVEGSE